MGFNMFFRRYTSLLVTTSILVQSISPTFAMYEDCFEKKSSKKLYSTIINISEMDETAGVVVQPGDWLILDIDGTVLKRGKDNNQDILNLDPKVVEMVKNWQTLNANEPAPKKHITLLFLTARKPEKEQQTREQLKKAGFPENIKIIFAPNDKSSGGKIPTKGKALIQELNKSNLKPRRMIMVEDLEENLRDVHETLQNNVAYKNIPLKLLKRKVDRKICESSDEIIQIIEKTTNNPFKISIDTNNCELPDCVLLSPKKTKHWWFPKKLTDLTYIRSIGGGSGGVHVLKDKNGQLFTFKSATSSEQIKEEILADALYRSLGVKVPAFAIYDHLPDIPKIHKACTGPGPFRLAHFIEEDSTASNDMKAQEMRKHFVADALLSNFDIVVDNFKNVALDKSGTLWRLDNGGSLRLRACGGSKFGYEDWEPHAVKELETMINKTKDGAFVYGSLTEEAIKEQVQDILKRSADLFKTSEEMAKKLHLNNPSEVREILRLRLDYLVKKFLPTPNLPIMDGFMASQFAAGVLPISIDPHTGQKVILLGKRIGHNWWCNFGGSSDLNMGLDSDKTLAHTAVREVQEESLGNISFTPLELKKTPSHAILNSDNVFYRMYMAHHPYVAEEKLEKALSVPEYGWKPEYTEYRWVPLDKFLFSLNQNHLVEEESRKTIQIGDMILYPYFWEMLQESDVKNTLENICAGRKVRAKHTHDGKIQPIVSPLSVEAEKQQRAETIVRKGFLLGQIKSRDPVPYKFQVTPPVLIGPRQKNLINIFTTEGALFLKSGQENPVKLLPFSATSFETEKFEHIVGQTYQGQKSEQKVTLLPESSYKKLITCVKRGIEPSDLEKNALLMALGLMLSADNEPEHDEEIQKMSGFLKNEEAEELREILRHAPYTQTEAYLRHRMGEEVYNSLGGLSDKQVEVFLDEHSKFPNMLLSYKVQFQDFNKPLEQDVLEVFLKDKDLYLRVKNKEILKINIRQENDEPASGLSQAEYDLLTDAVMKNEINLVNYFLQETIRTYANQIGYTPKLPLDPHYKQVLKEVMDAEKQNREKIPFLHGTDPLTSFLWDFITANRSQLKNLGANAHTTMRAFDKKFASILDVEAFIKTYNENNRVDNYSTVKDIHYADLGLSVNPFLFGNDGNFSSSTYYLFHQAQSVSPTNQEQLFNAFMAATGIPGKWKDYKALYQQYYLRDTKHNTKLFQIFIDPQVVDCCAYTAVSGGAVLDLTMNNKPYHGFAKTMAELRTSPEESDEKIQNRISGKLGIHRDLNNLQGRLFLNPKIFLDPKYVDIKTYWRHPISEELEISYYNKLNRQVAQDLAYWLPQHCYLDGQTFVEGIPALKKSYQYMYEGEMKLPYREQELKSILPSAIKEGNVQLIQQILEKNPDIDINEHLPNISYRGYGTTTLAPLGFLNIDTPNFSEVIKIFVEKGLKGICYFGDAEITHKFLNELFLYQDKMSNELSNVFKNLLRGRINPFARTLIEYIKKDYKSLISYILNESSEIDINNYTTNEDLQILIKELKSNTTLKNLKMGKNVGLSLLTLLTQENDKGYRQTQWFQNAWDDMIRNSANYVYDSTNQSTKIIAKKNDLLMPFMNLLMMETGDKYSQEDWYKDAWTHIVTNPSDYIPTAFKEKKYLFISNIIKNLNSNTLDLNFLEFSPELDAEGLNALKNSLQSNSSINTLKLSFREADDEWFRTLLEIPHIKTIDLGRCPFYDAQPKIFLEILKNNSTLNKLMMDDNSFFKIINELLLHKEAKFYQAPWFTEKWEQILNAPEANLNVALRNKYRALTTAIVTEAPGEIDFYKIHYSFDDISPFILNMLENNTPFKSGSLNFNALHLNEKELNSLVIALTRNTTLNKLTLSENNKLSVMSILDQDDTGAFRTAPWFKGEWNGIISSPIKMIQTAISNKSWAYLIKIIAQANPDVLDLTKLTFPWRFDRDLEAKWKLSMVEGLKTNPTLKGLVLTDYDMLDVMGELLSSPSGAYENAPWFVEEKVKLCKNPDSYIQHHTNFQMNYGAILSLLKISPEEIELGKYLKYGVSDFMNILSEELIKNGPISQLNLSGMSGQYGEEMSKLADALKKNTKLISLNLGEGNFYEKEENLLIEGLKNNSTLRKLSLSKKAMFSVLNGLIQDPEWTSSKAPWFDATWKEIIEDSLEENIKLAKEKKNLALITKLFADTKANSFDLDSSSSRYDDSWVDPVLNGLKANNTIQKLKINISYFNNEERIKILRKILQKSKSLKILNVDYSRLEDKTLDNFCDILKEDICFEDLLVSSHQLKLKILNCLFPVKDQLVEAMKKWVATGIEDLMSDPSAAVKSCMGGYGEKALGNLLTYILESITELKISTYGGLSQTLLEEIKANKTISVLDLEVSGACYSYGFPELAKVLEETDRIHTVRLETEYSFSKKDITAFCNALIKNNTFNILDLSKNSRHQNKLDSENLATLADAMKQTNFSKTLKVCGENELDLLNAVLPNGELMTSHWLNWMNPLWEKIVENPQASLVNAIRKAHQNIAEAILRMGTVSRLEMNETLWGNANNLLIHILKTDQALEAVEIDDYEHRIFMELFPHKDTLSTGVQTWIESTWNALMENSEKAFQDALEPYEVNEKLAEMILNKGGVITLTLSEMRDSKLSNLFKILRNNSALETLTLSGESYNGGISSLLDNLRSNKNLVLKTLDLRGYKIYHKIDEYDFKNYLKPLLEKKTELTIIMGKDAFKEKILTNVMNSPFVESGQLVIKELDMSVPSGSDKDL